MEKTIGKNEFSLKSLLKIIAVEIAGLMLIGLLIPGILIAGTAAEIDEKVNSAMPLLYESSEAAVKISKVAKGVLVFPKIYKAGFLVGGQYGEGALLVNDVTESYYSTIAGSFGLQAGAQSFGYAMFLMNEKSINYLKKTDGWELGVGPSITIVDAGFAKSLTTSSLKEDIYVFFFNQKGLMGGLGIQGTKVTPFTPKE